MISAVFFDVANTLLNKPDLYTRILLSLKEFGIRVNEGELIRRHRLLSEVVTFPDKTSREFYNEFNRELLISLGITPDEEFVSHIFQSCTYLPWKPFDDTKVLEEVKLPIGILSNWDDSLPQKLKEFFSVEFKWVLGSQLQGKRKPDPGFFNLMLEHSYLKPEEILYVGDSVKLDILPARKLGIKAVLIDRINLYPDSNLNRISNLREVFKFI